MVKQTAGRDSLGDFAPKFAELNDDILFGEVWSREAQLSLKMRSILTVSALVSKGLVDSSFQFHVVNAKKNGVTKEEMAEILTHLAFYAGWPNAWAAFRVAVDVYKEDNGADGGQILLCTNGRGWYQEWNREARELFPGDVVFIPAGVKHWHGAARDSWFSHVAFEAPGEDCSNEWLEPVDDEQYGKLR